MANISREVQTLASAMTDIRRDLRQHPELGLQEIRTAGMVARRLLQLG